MKRNVLKTVAALTASLFLISTGSVVANADELLGTSVPAITAPTSLETFMTASGYSLQQIQQIQEVSVQADHYVAYFNLTDDPELLDDFYVMHTGAVTAQVGWASTQTYDGYVLNEDLVGIHNDVTPTGYSYQHNERVVFTVNPNYPPEFSNLIRFKLHGSGNITTYALNLVQFDNVSIPNVNDYISCGTVQAGNVTKYITGSSDTGNLITAADASRVLQHVGDLNSGLSDPYWTDEATIAADVNFDGVVDLIDVQKIVAILNGGPNFW